MPAFDRAGGAPVSCISNRAGGRRRGLTRNQFARYFNAFGRSFDRLQTESLKTLNLLTLVRTFPESRERLTDLQFQIDRETQAQAEHYRQMSRLCALLVEPGLDNGKTGVNSLWIKKAEVLAQKFGNHSLTTGAASPIERPSK